MVERHHFSYLINAARHYSGGPFGFRWFHNGDWHTVGPDTAQMLNDENLASLRFRYPNGTASGYKMTDADSRLMFEIDPVAVLKSIACLDYQSCEHPGWELSSARAFLRALETAAIQALPGYEAAKWGAPLPLAEVSL